MNLTANPPFNNSDTALPAYTCPNREAKMQSVSEAKGNMTGLCKVGTTNFELQSSRVFNSTLAPALPVCLWFLAKNKADDAKRSFRDRRKQILFQAADPHNGASRRISRFLMTHKIPSGRENI